jgi:hypothetical protein
MLADFTIFTKDGGEFRCHRAILAARSPVFAAMLTADFRETREGRMEAGGEAGQQAMGELLRFVYSGEVRNIRGLEQEIFELADLYEFQGLKVLEQNTIFIQ